MRNSIITVIFTVVFFFSGFGLGVSHAQDIADQVEVKIMPGLMVDPGVGGSFNFILTSKKINFPIEPAIDLGLGSRATSIDQTAEDVSTHAGAGLCVWKLFCGTYIYDFQAADKRFNFTVDALQILSLSQEALSTSQ